MGIDMTVFLDSNIILDVFLKNKDFCEECRATWLLQPEKTSCNKTCDYCLTPYFEFPNNKSRGRCINCKEYFNPEDNCLIIY